MKAQCIRPHSKRHHCPKVSTTGTAFASLGIEQRRSQEEPDRCVVRLSLNVSGLGQTVRFLSNKVDLFYLNAPSSLAGGPERADVYKRQAFYNVGCDVVETDTFGATRVVLAEYDLQDKVHEINFAAAKLAREVAASFSSNGRKRFVAGDVYKRQLRRTATPTTL